MRILVLAAALVATVLSVDRAPAAERTVVLAVENMYCPSCPYIVKKSLARVPGVNAVDVSLEKETATVTYDETKTNVEQLTDATFDAGYPSELADQAN